VVLLPKRYNKVDHLSGGGSLDEAQLDALFVAAAAA